MASPISNIFLSYAWANKNIADIIDNDFKNIGVYVQRDIRDVPYRGDLEEYMQRAAKSDFVLVILSDEYLKSINCMYEVIEVLNTHQLDKKVLPVLNNVPDIFNQNVRKLYYDYWKNKILEAENHSNQHLNADTLAELKKCKNIYDCLGEFFNQIKRLKSETFENLKEENYKPIFEIVGWNEGSVRDELIVIQTIEDVEEKELKLDEFLSKYPDNGFGLLYEAYNEIEQKRFKKAKAYYERVIEKYPHSEIAHYSLAVLMRENFLDYEEAKKHYQMAIELNPNFDNAHINLGVLLQNKFADYEGAKEHYLIALSINPQNHIVHNNLATLLSDHCLDSFNARNHYQIAIENNPFDGVYHNNLANLLQKFYGDYEGAKQHYEFAINLDANYFNAHTNFALLYKDRYHNYEKAEEHFLTAISINPKFAKAHFFFALLLKENLSNFDEAKKHYLLSTKIDNNFIKEDLDTYFSIMR